ncbi:MAG: response regulator [Desulfobacteraceae bacterium]|nr:MAG: response regulator [Desulfobacteraceae bacterium]
MAVETILVVDDEEAIVRLLSMSLRSDGYSTLTASDGAEAFELVKEKSPDLVITDIKMPRMDGLELLKTIKEYDPDMEVIIVTGHGDIDSTITALQYGASDFINKPVRDEALSIALARAKEKIEIREKLAEYTLDLEEKVKMATEVIRRRANFQQLLIRSSNDGIVAFDSNWKIVVFNPEAARIFEQKASDVLNKMTVDELCPESMAQIFKSDIAGDDEKNLRLPWEETIFRINDNTIPVRFSRSVLHEKGEMVGSVVFFQDLTEIKKLEKDLLQSERLAAVGQTVSGLAHYIKNILIGLKGGSYVVDVGLKKDDTNKLKEGWRTIKKNIERSSDLVQNLLTYSKEREPEKTNCFPNEVVSDVITLVKDYAKENNIEVTPILDDSIGEVVIDPDTLHRSLLNLVSNGIDACLDDENIDKDWEITVRTFKEADRVIGFEVRDNGSGMDDDTKAKLFSPFFSSKGGKGTGLGLMVTSKMIEEHKGTIDIDSTLGKGTAFTIRLPYQTVTGE